MKSIFRHISALVIFTLASACAFAQCQIQSDFNQYQVNGMSSTIQWDALSSQSVICSSSDWQPSFFVNEDSLLNVKVTGEIFVSSTTNDDDFIGFVFGYKSPTFATASNDNHFYLFDWKKVGQHAPDEYGGFLAKEGFNLSYADGIIASDPVTTYQYFWGHEENENFTHINEKYGNNLGWEFNTTYHFELIYTFNKIIISIDGVEIFNVDGCFKPGLFGFYSFNQNGVNYRNVVIEQIYSYKTSSENDTYCEERPVYFEFLDTSCTYVPPSLVAYEWNFGDGSPASYDLFPQHEFNDAGIYNVELLLTNTEGCTDTVNGSVFIEPKPHIVDQPIDRQCNVGDAIEFSIVADHAEYYQWYYQSEGMSYWSKVVNNGYFSGATTPNLSVYNVRPQFDQMKLRCVVDGACFNLVTSNYAKILITDIPIRAELGTSESSICALDSTFLLITLKELYQIKSANLRILFNGDNFEITNYTTYFQSISFDFDIQDNYVDISMIVNEPVNLNEAIIAALDLKAIQGAYASNLFTWDLDHTYFLNEINDTINRVLYNASIFVYQPFSPQFEDTLEMCQGDIIQLDEQLFRTFLWNTGEETSYFVANESGDYSVDLIDRNGCYSSDGFHLNMNTYPEDPIGINLDKVFYCAYEDTILIQIEGGSGTSLHLVYNDELNSDTIIENPFYKIPNPGVSFNISAFWESICGISSSIEKEIPVYEPANPKVTIITDHLNYELGEVLTFTAHTEDEGINPNFIWLVDDEIVQVGADSVFTTSNLNGNEKVRVILYSDERCIFGGNTSEDALNVILQSGSDMYVPSLVSPNGDGVNDSFHIIFRNTDIGYFSLQIFDIQGKLIFETNNPEDHWNGQNIRKNGIFGIYTYKIEYSKVSFLSDKQLKIVTGKFLLEK